MSGVVVRKPTPEDMEEARKSPWYKGWSSAMSWMRRKPEPRIAPEPVEPPKTPRQVRAQRMYQRVAIDGLTLQQAGEEFGVTRERIRQILKQEFGWAAHSRQVQRMHIRAEAKKMWTCKRCGNIYDRTKVTYLQHVNEVEHAPEYGARSDYERNKAIAADYASGMLMKDMEAKWHMTAGPIHRARRQFDVPMRAPWLTKHRTLTRAESTARKESIQADFAAGMAYNDIAAKHDVSNTLVYRVLRGSGIYADPSETAKKAWATRKRRAAERAAQT